MITVKHARELRETQTAAEASLWFATQYLTTLGFRVIRFWNYQVLNNLSGVLQSIHNECIILKIRDYSSK